MNLKSFHAFAAANLLFFATIAAWAQSPYFNAINSLSPAGYWPMHEVEASARGDIETNYGSLKTLATGYYSDWESNNTSTTFTIHQSPGALANDSDSATVFLAPAAGGAAANQCMIAPHTSPLLTIKPPFTLEAWVFPTNITSFGVILGEGGNAGLNGTNNFDGFQMGFGANEFQMQYYTGVGGGSANHVSSAIYPTNHWYYCVVTYDGVNTHMYVNGSDVKDTTDTMAPSTWSPLVVGSGKWGAGPIRNLVGAVDEVAIYTNVISDIGQHYTDGSSGSSGAYVSDVLADNPIVYYRMDAPTYTAPNVSAWPALINDGSVAVNGVYTPGTVPGGGLGASYSGFPLGLSGGNVALLSGMSTFADAGNNSLYNPTGLSAVFSISAIFRGNPADPRVQSICGRGTNSWEVGLTTGGKIVFNAGTGGATGATGTAVGDLVSAKIYNDGLWHQLVVTHNGTNNTLYVDGVLDSTNSSSPATPIPGSTSDVFIGADPSYTNNPTCIGRQFGGEICDVAFFTTQLQLSDVQNLYTASHIAPYITQQPISTTAIQNAGFTNTIVAGGSATLAYQWYVNSSSSAIATSAPISGQTSASLVLNPVQSNNATNYFVVVTNNFGSVTSAVVSLTVVGAPTISGQTPLPYTSPFLLFAGASPKYSISAVGTPPLAYLWFTNNVLDTAATNSSFTWTNVQSASFSNYCIVTNLFGSATSMLWRASVIAAPTAPYPTSVLAAGPIGYWRLNENSDDNNGNNGAICHDYVGGNNGIYTNVYLDNAAAGTGYSPSTDPTVPSVFFGFFNNPDSDANSIAGIDFSSPTNTSQAFTVETWAQGYGSQTLSAGLVTKGFSGGEQFCLDAGSPNSCYRFFMRDASGTVHTVNSTVPASKNYDNGDIWHHLVGVCDEANGNVAFYIDGQLIGTNAVTPGSGVLTSANTMTIGARMGAATGNNNNQFIGFMNDVAVYNYALSAGEIVAQYSEVPTKPFITQQPSSSVNVNGGGSFSISAAAFGTPPLSYAWYDVNANSVISGQTNNTLTLSNVFVGDTYYLIVTNIYGLVDSANATVTVNNSAPVINSQTPLTNSFTIFSTARPIFALTASGTLPISYLWFTNNVRDAAATNATFIFTNPPSAGFTTYCILTNTLGSNTSMVWTVSTIPGPTAPYPQLILSNNPIAYWRLDEHDDGLNNGNTNVVCHDYVGGNNGVYNDVFLGQSGYNPTADPDTAADFTNIYPSCAYGMPGPDFGLANGQSGAFSIEFWQQSSAGFNNNGTGNYVSKGGSGATQFNIDNQGANGNYAFVIHNAGATIFGPIDSGVNASDGNWHHIVGTVDENQNSQSNMIFYVDGVARAWATVPTASGILPETSSPIYIGCSISQASGQTVGKIDEVALYNYALTPAQVVADYQTGLSSGVVVNTNPTNILFSVSGNQLNLSWPADHTGWQLQAQTNSVLVGISTNWFNVSGTPSVHLLSVPINLTNGTVFYRLVYP